MLQSISSAGHNEFNLPLNVPVPNYSSKKSALFSKPVAFLSQLFITSRQNKMACRMKLLENEDVDNQEENLIPTNLDNLNFFLNLNDLD